MELCIPSLGSDPVFALARRAESSRFGGRMDDDDFLTSSASTMETPSLEEERRLEEPASDWSAVREDDDAGRPALRDALDEVVHAALGAAPCAHFTTSKQVLTH